MLQLIKGHLPNKHRNYSMEGLSLLDGDWGATDTFAVEITVLLHCYAFLVNTGTASIFDQLSEPLLA